MAMQPGAGQEGQYGGAPVVVLKEGTEQTRGKDAQSNNIMVGKIISETVKSTFGPRGMDKMLVDSVGDIVVTNDGATILKEMDIEHPTAKMIVEVAETQETEVGDGTTTAVVLAGELLKQAEELLEQDVHPTVVARGYRMAAEKAQEELEEIAIPIDVEDNEFLKKVATTAMTGKGGEVAKEHLASVVIEAIRKVTEKGSNGNYISSDDIKLEKREGGSVEDTELIDGLVVDKEVVHSGMPRRIKDAKVALLNTPLEIEKTEFDAEIRINDPGQLQSFVNEEEKMLKDMVEKVKASGANVLFCQKGIDDMAQHFLSKEGIAAVRRVKKSDMEKLSKATGANIVTNIEDIGEGDLGHAGRVEEEKIGDEDMIFVRECQNPRAVTVLIRGGTEHIVDEVERAIEDCLGVVPAAIRDGKVVPGGGSPEIELAMKLNSFAKNVEGREQLAVEAFVNAMESIPRALAENAGLDPIDILVSLRTSHEEGKGKSYGVDVYSGKVRDLSEEGVVDPFTVKTQAIDSASEVAEMILRIDDVVSSKQGGGEEAGGGMPPGGGGMPMM